MWCASANRRAPLFLGNPNLPPATIKWSELSCQLCNHIRDPPLPCSSLRYSLCLFTALPLQRFSSYSHEGCPSTAFFPLFTDSTFAALYFQGRRLSQIQKYRMTTTAYFSGQLFCVLYAWFMFLNFSSEISFSTQTLESCSAFQSNMLTNLQSIQNSLPWTFRTAYWNETDLLWSGS